MAPSLLFDISSIDLTQILRSVDDIERVNPHRGAMRMLDGVIWENEDASEALAFHDVREDEFWVPGHIPGRPIFPGVLMIETAAQFASFLFLRRMGERFFMGFAGVDNVKFRGQVVPGDRFHLLLREVDFRRRRSICTTQGVVNGQLVFEGTVTGMPI